MIQLNPTIPLEVVSGDTPHGKADAHILFAETEHPVVFVVFMRSDGQCWCVEQQHVRLERNLTAGTSCHINQKNSIAYVLMHSHSDDECDRIFGIYLTEEAAQKVFDELPGELRGDKIKVYNCARARIEGVQCAGSYWDEWKIERYVLNQRGVLPENRIDAEA